jgi:5-methylcytosine-specific restriction endonuclease McrBC regulatory subunit McrC
MEAFYEAWVETVLATAARQTGGLLHTGRNRETVHALDWRPGLTGAQRALIPDFRIDYPAATVIVDAKYKRHFDELHSRSWHTIEDEIRDQHRHDLLQILAYSSLAPTDRAVLCLAYPCAADRWQSLRDRNRLHHRAEISVGSRSLRLWLTAIPMSVDTPTVAAELAAQLRHLAA